MGIDYRYYEEDKAMSKKIMEEFEGKTVESKCPTCGGKPVNGHVCDDCKGQGFYEIEY